MPRNDRGGAEMEPMPTVSFSFDDDRVGTIGGANSKKKKARRKAEREKVSQTA